jgi:hypothetical protein
MVKKYKLTLFLFLAFFSVSVMFKLVTTSAQENLIFGQEHAYSVFVKSNQEAFIFARLALTNPDESALTKSSFTLSNAKASEMSVYQVVLPQECAQYNYRSGNNDCIRYKEPSYTQDYSYYGNSYGDEDEIEYYKINYQEANGKYSFNLPKPVDPYKSTAIIAIYATKDYISSSVGRYKYDFETLAVDQRVTKSSVAVTAETDYQLKNPEKDDYSYYGGLEMGASMSSVDIQSSFSNPDIDSLVYSIGSSGQHNKTFNNITPNETVVASGLFANSWFKLYMFEVLFIIIGLIGFFALLIYFSKKYGKRLGRINQTGAVAVNSTVQNRFTLLVPLYWIASFVSVLVVGGLTMLITALGRSDAFNSMDNSQPIVSVFAVLIVGLIYLLAIFGPAIFVGIRYKWKAAVTVIALQLIWYTIAILIINSSFSQ